MSHKSWTVDYSSVDWSKGNAEIARELGIDPSTVWGKRRRLGLSSAPRKLKFIGLETLLSGAIVDWDKTIYTKRKSGDLCR
mgnify:CR=1 FL=1